MKKFYGLKILDGRQKAKARSIIKRFNIKPHSEIERSPLTLRFNNSEDALLGLKAMKLYNVKARLVFHLA